MIKLFGQTDTAFSSNGDVVLSPLKAKVHKDDNGDYYLDLECGLEYVDFITEGRIIVANTPTSDQAFRIGNVNKTKNKIETRCWHVFYDSENYLIEDSYVLNKNCNDALLHLNNATEPESEFTVFSDVTHVDSFRCVRQSLYEAIQTVIERWGGHLVRDNFLISVRQEIGTDNGIIVQYKKNLKDIVCQENWDNVVTKILPTGQDGIMLNALDQTADVYITSETQYAIPYTKTVSFEQDINQDDYPTEQAYQQALVDDLRAQATAYLDANCIPQVSYTLKANLDRVTDIGDTVEVIDERLGVNLMTHVIGFDYDCISQKYTEVEFGSFSQTLSGFASQMTSNTQKIVSQAVGNVSDEVMGILTKSYVIYDGASILIVDTLPKENAQNVIKIDNSGVGFSQTGIQGQFTSKWDIDGSITLSQDVTIDGKPLTDFITASGTDDGWDWVEYKSGNIEATTQIEVESTDVTWSTLITGLNKGEIPLTMLSTIDNPIVTAEIESCGTDVGWVAMADDTKITMIRTGNTGTIKLNIAVRGTKASPQSP